MSDVNDLGVGVVQALSDALHMVMEVGPGARVRGATCRVVEVPATGGLMMPVRLEVVSSFSDVTGTDVGVLLAGGLGGLALFAWHSSILDSTQIYVVDTRGLHGILLEDFFETTRTRSLTGALRKLKSGLVSGFLKSGDLWSPISLAGAREGPDGNHGG